MGNHLEALSFDSQEKNFLPECYKNNVNKSKKEDLNFNKNYKKLHKNIYDFFERLLENEAMKNEFEENREIHLDLNNAIYTFEMDNEFLKVSRQSTRYDKPEDYQSIVSLTFPLSLKKPLFIYFQKHQIVGFALDGISPITKLSLDSQNSFEALANGQKLHEQLKKDFDSYKASK
jgi:hypothetical protein